MRAGLLVVAVVSVLGAFACAAPEREMRFDGGWRFFRGDAAGASEPGFDDSSWRRVDLPHDWSIEDVPPAKALPAIGIVKGAWRFKPGDDPAWKEPALDDAAWQEVALPAAWEDHSGHAQDNVHGWFRRRIAIPADLRGKEFALDLGKIDDVDETFLNGVKIGGTGAFPPAYTSAWDRPRRYTVDPALVRGDGGDVVAVRVFDGAGRGGIYADAATPSAFRGGPFDPDLTTGGRNNGYTVNGVGWYRKTFEPPSRAPGGRVMIRFDGVYMHSQVWINGARLGEHPYGYTPFVFDLTPHLRSGPDNVIAVRVDASGDPSRWYHGSGIWRHVWLIAVPAVHIDTWGVSITTPRASAEKAAVRVATTVRNDGGAAQHGGLRTSILDAARRTVAQAVAPAKSLGPQASRTLFQEIEVRAPALWSPDAPALYTCVSEVLAGDAAGSVIDRVETPFGIRAIAIDAARGLLLNGAPLELRGGCIHHDHGCLGAASFDRAEERRVELLKANGFNALRTSHNPPSPALLDACDRLGMLVIDEAFDCWKQGKTGQDYGRFFEEWWRRDLEAMVLRDCNHPSVFIWSIGNEVPGQNTPEFFPIAKQLAHFVRALDPSRPVTLADCPTEFPRRGAPEGLHAAVDVRGYNYQWERYAADAKRASPPPTIGTESFPLYAFDQWMGVLDHPHVIGDFVWTAIDYLGEAGLGYWGPYDERPGRTTINMVATVSEKGAGGWSLPYAGAQWLQTGADQDRWLVVTAQCGDLDLCGFKRPPSYYRDVLWQTGARVSAFVHPPYPEGTRIAASVWSWPDVRASWTWPDLAGKPLAVDVYSACPRVRLALNGRSLGEKETNRGTRFIASWKVPYEPGTLAAVGLDAAGKEIARWELATAGAPASIRLTADRAALRPDSQDLAFVTVEVLDGRGILCPDADNLVRFTIEGPATLAGVCSGNPRSLESFQKPERRAFRGRCLAVIKADGTPGTVTLTARADGLAPAETRIAAGGAR